MRWFGTTPGNRNRICRLFRSVTPRKPRNHILSFISLTVSVVSSTYIKSVVRRTYIYIYIYTYSHNRYRGSFLFPILKDTDSTTTTTTTIATHQPTSREICSRDVDGYTCAFVFFYRSCTIYSRRKRRKRSLYRQSNP